MYTRLFRKRGEMTCGEQVVIQHAELIVRRIRMDSVPKGRKNAKDREYQRLSQVIWELSQIQKRYGVPDDDHSRSVDMGDG